MEKSIKITDFESICRLCLEKNVTFRQLFKTESKRIYKNSVLSCIKVLIDSEINSSDGLPQQICEVCHMSLSRFGMFQRRCIKSVATLKAILKQNESVKLELGDRPQSPIVGVAGDVNSSNVLESELKLELPGDVELKTTVHEERKTDTSVRLSTDEDFKDIDLELIKVEPIDYNINEPAIEIIEERQTKRQRREVTKKSIPIIENRDELFDVEDSDEEFKAPKRRRRRSTKNNKSPDSELRNELSNETGSGDDKETKPRRKYRFLKRVKRTKVPARERIKGIQTDLELFPETSDRKSDKPNEKDDKEKQMCPLCGELYQNVNLHLITHTTEKNHECDECGKAFKTNGSLKTHKMAIHMQLRKFKCTVCQSFFKSKMHLKMHRIVHTGERKFECTVCNRQLSTISSYRCHMLTHTQERNHECPHCHEKFITRQRLHHHLPKHTGEKIFQCGICTVRFRYSSAATQHRRRHMNHNSAYVCTFCQAEFKNMRLFIIHHEAIHNVKLPLPENSVTEEEQQEIAEN